MKKYLYVPITVIYLTILTGVASANWYGTNWYPTSGTVTNCPSDGYTDSIFSPGFPPMAGGSPYYPAGQVRVINNVGSTWIQCQKWDSTPPPSLFATNSSPTWKNTPINLNLYTLDEGGGSAISTSRYAWDGSCVSGMTFSFGAPLVQATNGSHTLYLCAWDNAGNSTLDYPITFYRFDNIKPPIVSATLSMSSTWRTSPIVGITMTASDDVGGSGIKYAKYIWGTTASPPLESTCRASGLPITTTTQSTNGQNVLRICVEDNAGNQENWVGDYWLDAALPTASASPASFTWTNLPISINLTAGDTGGSSLTQSKYVWQYNNSGAAPTKVTCLAGGTSFAPGGQNIFLNIPAVQGRHTLYLCTQDGAGNQNLNIYGNYEYDTTLPVVTANNNSATWWTANYNATLFAHDPIPYAGAVVSDTTLATRRYIWDMNMVGPTPTIASCLASGTSFSSGTVLPITTEGDHGLYICSRDQANNTGTLWVGQYRLDKSAPVASTLTYASGATNGWTNNVNITLNWTASDNILSAPTIPSGLKNYDIKVYRTTSQNNPTALDYLTTITTLTAATTYNYPGQDGYSYMFEIVPRDNAGNVGAVLTSSHIARIDTVNPTAGTITTTTLANLLATNNQLFNFGYNDGGAPVRIEYSFEQNGNPFGFDNLNTTIFATTHNYNRDISTVDTDRGGNGGRQIDVNITRICDWAGNCIGPGPLRTISHFVYANTTSASATGTSTILTDGTAVVDGSSHVFTISVADTYGNKIVPASGINRVINMSLSNIVNMMYLDQHARTGVTSVYLTAPNNTADVPLAFSTTYSFTNPITSITTGDYPFAINAYTPTANSYTSSDPVSDNTAQFTFDANINTITDTLAGPRTFVQSIGAPIFNPLYTTNITGNLEDGGFIEGTEQTGAISFTHNSGVTPSGASLQLEFSGAQASSFSLSGADITANMTPISTLADMAPSPITFTSTTTLATKLTQNPNITVNGTSNIQLSTHLKYVLDGKNILYNSDLIGKTGGYWGAAATALGNQVGIKIIGAIGSNNISSLVINQFSTGTSIFDGLSRSDVRNSVRKSVALAIRNAPLATYSSTISSFANLDAGVGVTGVRIAKDPTSSIIYVKKTGGTVTLNSIASVIGVSGRRTLVVEGADLYINSDLYYTSPDSILGVVIQKDANGNGGNLYINPNITNIVGSYVIDGSVMSSNDGIGPIGSSNIFSLKNQLYIHGSLVSENTIGGSRNSPLKCPSLINPLLCNSVELAQQYDLNYLRRYYLYGGIPFGTGFGGTKVIGGGTCSGPTIPCAGFGVLASKFTMPTEDLARYPVIIEYNPAIRSNPPIGFEDAE